MISSGLPLRGKRTTFRPWLVQIGVNEARNRRRAAGRRAGLTLRLAPDPAETESAPSAESEALAGQDRARLPEAVMQLREDDQLIIAARYFLALSEAETATALKLRRGTVKSRLARALGRLKRQLEDAMNSELELRLQALARRWTCRRHPMRCPLSSGICRMYVRLTDRRRGRARRAREHS